MPQPQTGLFPNTGLYPGATIEPAAITRIRSRSVRGGMMTLLILIIILL